MRSLLSIFFLLMLSLNVSAEQGTMSPDDSKVSDSEASLSGYDLPEREEVQLIEEEEFYPAVDEGLTEEEEFYLEEEQNDSPLPTDY